jgi:signal peptidase II
VAQGSYPDRRRVLLVFLLVGAGAMLIDQVTKHLSVISLEDRDPVRLLGGAVYLTLVRNSGAAFSLGTDVTFIFPLVAIVVLGVLALVIRKVRSIPWAVALGLVLGGVLGNFGDRLFRSPGPFVGHVVDMVSVFDAHGRVFPVFNAADAALTIGVALIILLELTGRQRDGTRLPSRAERAAAERAAADRADDEAAGGSARAARPDDEPAAGSRG